MTFWQDFSVGIGIGVVIPIVFRWALTYPKRENSDDLEFNISRFEFGRDDILLVKAKSYVPPDVAERIKKYVLGALGDDGSRVRVLVYDESLDIAVLTRAEIERREIRAPSGKMQHELET